MKYAARTDDDLLCPLTEWTRTDSYFLIAFSIKSNIAFVVVSFASNRLPWISLWLVIGSKLTITGHSIENQWWQDYVQVQTFCHCLEYTEVACNHLYHTMFLGKWFMEVMTFRYWREVPIAYKRAGHAQISKGKVEFMTIKSECMFTSIHAQRRAAFQLFQLRPVCGPHKCLLPASLQVCTVAHPIGWVLKKSTLVHNYN